MRKNSVKNIRINSEVQREMSRIISEEIKDPRVHPMTSVMGVEVTPDLKYAKIFISVFGSEEEKQKTMEGLKKSASFARGQLAKRSCGPLTAQAPEFRGLHHQVSSAL